MNIDNTIKISWDMETSDPDDVFTLCLLAAHPQVNLQSVTIHPGSIWQVGLVKHILRMLDKTNVPVGSAKPEHPKQCVSEFHYKWLGNIEPEQPDDIASTILNKACSSKIITGAALTNIGNLISLKNSNLIDEIVIQGGFAGDNVVPEEYRLEKFKGKITCPTFNLNGNVAAAKTVISSNKFKVKRFISKNVCHGIIYDYPMHERIKLFRYNNAGIDLIFKGMSKYLENKASGKAFHDPLAACCAIASDCCDYREVEIYRNKGEWGSSLKDETNTFISINCNRDRFEEVLVGNI